MKEKILTFLKTKLSGVSENYLLGVADFYSKTITDEKQIDTTFTDGVIDLLKLNADILQKEGDRRATEAQKTALKNFQDKHGLDDNGKPIEDPGKKGPGRPKKDTDPEEPAWFKEYREKSEAEQLALKTKLEGFEKEKTQSSLQAKIAAKLKEKGIPETYFKGRNLVVESEDKIDALVTTVETDFNEFKQDMAEKGVNISIPPSSGATVKEGEAVGKSAADKRNQKSSEGVGAKKL